jgi:FkbM family methyltransferase
MNFFKVLNKFRRELYKPMSKICLKKSVTNYFGLHLKIPIIYGVGAGFLVPGDKWMSDCLAIFLKMKQGIVVDVGVNVGLYLVKLKALDETREYIGFEPNPLCNYYTQELVKENNFQHVRVFPFALSDKKEQRSFYVKRKADKMGSLNSFARFGDKDKVSFELITFSGDEFFGMLEVGSICVIKIDVEGAEMEVLQGLRSTIEKSRPFILCEIWSLPDESHPSYSEKHERLVKIYAWLETINYKIIGIDIDKHDRLSFFKIESCRQLGGEHRGDFILAHAAEVDQLQLSLQNIN